MNMAIHFHTVGRESVRLDVIGENTQLKDYILRKVGAGVSGEEQSVRTHLSGLSG